MAEEAYMDETATDKNTGIDVLAKEFISHLAAHNHSVNSVRGY